MGVLQKRCCQFQASYSETRLAKRKLRSKNSLGINIYSVYVLSYIHNVKRLPTPSSLSTPIVAPWAWTMRSTIANPKPLPAWVARGCDRSVQRYGAIPPRQSPSPYPPPKFSLPVRLAHAHLDLTWLGVNLSALSSKLPTAIPNRCSSTLATTGESGTPHSNQFAVLAPSAKGSRRRRHQLAHLYFNERQRRHARHPNVTDPANCA